MQRVGMNNVQSHTLFLSLDFMLLCEVSLRYEARVVWCFSLSSSALCLCHFVPLCLPEQLP